MCYSLLVMTRFIKKAFILSIVWLVLAGCRNLSQERRSGALNILAKPAGTVYIEGISRGTTPFYNDQLEPGEYLVRITSEAGEWSGKVKVVPGAVTVVSRELAPEPAGEAGEVITFESGRGLAVISEPNAAVVIIDGQEVGMTPWVGSQIKPGEHMVVLRLPGYQERTVKVDVRNGYRLTIVTELAGETIAFPTPVSALPTPIPTAPLETEPSGPAVVIQETGTAFGLRVRSGPGLSYSIVTNVEPGQVLPLLEERPEWVKIRLPDGAEGWVSSRYVGRR